MLLLSVVNDLCFIVNFIFFCREIYFKREVRWRRREGSVSWVVGDLRFMSYRRLPGGEAPCSSAEDS